MSDELEDWPRNYFNYFTEVEEHFQQARGTGLFLLSPLDWALIESWKDAGVPLEAVLRGIDEAFENWRTRRSKVQMVNSLAFCAQPVLAEAQRMAGNAPPKTRRDTAPPFTVDELRSYLERNAGDVRERFPEIAASLERLAGAAEEHYRDLEELERRLAALEEKMVAGAKTVQSDEDLVAARREFDLQLRPYRSKMTTEQIALLERQFLERRLLDSQGLPRLSLFYMR